MTRPLLLLIFFVTLYADNEGCRPNVQTTNRSLYDIGDTLSVEDQNLQFEVCYGDGASNAGDIFKFSDLNGSVNGGDYNIILISMNATW